MSDATTKRDQLRTVESYEVRHGDDHKAYEDLKAQGVPEDEAVKMAPAVKNACENEGGTDCK